MYNYYQQQSPTALRTNLTAPFGLKGHPVSSLEEARALSIDFDGSIFYFPDIANKRIYTKQINMDGTATLNMYELKPIPAEPTAEDYVTRTEFEQTINNFTELLKQHLTPVVHKEEPSIPPFKEVF